MSTGIPAYRGRFAPSPTGPLHFGSLVAAVGSFLDARAHRGEWLLRMEDLDRPRCVPGAAEAILHTLQALGLKWDGPVMHQSARDPAYAAALARLDDAGQLYGCACTRREIADSALAGIDGPVYPGTCRGGLPPGREARAWRVRCDGAHIAFDDAIQGRIAQDLEREIGDFVLKRADGLFAYQLAVVVDDAEQGITDIVRGADLIDSTPRQIHLQGLLGLPVPRYAHLPVAVNGQGEKLSKQTLAAAVDAREPVPLLNRVLEFLGQTRVDDCETQDLAAFWPAAIAGWRRERVARSRSRPAPH
ncbi:MAG: tRNA glutamyl-Q(34) synthetase GluQRS [Betaproteobacteria bacterium]|nr:tRNA glutamyl-Q(34) synthetase GluQRS [Betaproteobacteria bacterium]